MGKFEIEEILEHPTMFTAMVSFNDKPAHYHEVPSLDPHEINLALQETADKAEAFEAEKEEASEALAELEVAPNGKLVE